MLGHSWQIQGFYILHCSDIGAIINAWRRWGKNTRPSFFFPHITSQSLRCVQMSLYMLWDKEWLDFVSICYSSSCIRTSVLTHSTSFIIKLLNYLLFLMIGQSHFMLQEINQWDRMNLITDTSWRRSDFTMSILQFVTQYSRKSLRVLGSVGEPINPSAWRY